MTDTSKDRILIVDDEPDIVTLLRFLLEEAGYEASSAPNGQAALELLGVEPANAGAPLPNLIILDIMMPVMDGYTFNTRLQKSPKANRIPIIVLTARGQSMRDVFEVMPNVASYLHKPFDPKMLRELIANILKKAKPS